MTPCLRPGLSHLTRLLPRGFVEVDLEASNFVDKRWWSFTNRFPVAVCAGVQCPTGGSTGFRPGAVSAIAGLPDQCVRIEVGILRRRCMLTHIDLFSGIGGFTVALHGVSRPILYCELKLEARLVLNRNMRLGKLPQAPVCDDICQLKCVPTCDIVTAGWPCTGHSVAGKRDGFRNKDSALFQQMCRVIHLSKARIAVWENVPQVMTDEEILRKALRVLNMKAVWTYMPAYVVGLPHNRRRWFCVCYRSITDLTPLCSLPRGPARPPPPLNGEQVEGYWKRWKLLGSSLVPQCARLAIYRCSRYAIAHDVTDFYHIPEEDRTSGVKPDLHLKLCGNGLVIHKPLWPSPRTNTHFSSLTERTSQDLQNAVKYYVNSRGGPNIEWVEWLMGYTRGWTRLG